MAKINVDTEMLRSCIKALRVFMKSENELLSNLRNKYQNVGHKWNDLQYEKFSQALSINEKSLRKVYPLIEDEIKELEKKLYQVQGYISETSGNDIIGGSGGDCFSVTERALFELEVLRDDLELTDGDPNVPQLGGTYGSIRGIIPGFEAHHIPSKAIQDASELGLPAIAISAQDHSLTDSYRGKQNHIHRSKWYQGTETYRNKAAAMISSGDYVQLVRYELLNIRDTCGHRYDGAIKQYLDALKEYIKVNGIPEALYR